MAVHFSLRAVQLDLARQMETVPFICQFIDFIAEHHFNTLFLYLEWRVRTKIFDIGEGQGYSPEEIRTIVSHGAARGVEVIPGIASLGHHDLLFSNPAYHRFCELRNDVQGRCGGSPKVEFCPSLPEARTFLYQYIREVAALFPSRYLHVGGDEAFNIGFCELCAPKTRDFAGESVLVRDFFRGIHDVVTGELGKRMMMWDDMFELYPAAFRELPRDIVLVNWNYSRNVSGWWGHFSNLTFVDHFSLYESLGFDYIIAPAEYMWSNTETFTCAIPKNASHVLGGLLTMWEKRHVLLYRFYPEIAAAGALWSQAGTPEILKRRALAELFGTEEQELLSLLETYMELPQRDARIRSNTLTIQHFFGPVRDRRFALSAMKATLERYLPRYAGTLHGEILTDIRENLQILEVYERAGIAGWQMLHHQEGETLEALAAADTDAWEPSIRHCRAARGESASLRFAEERDRQLSALKTFGENLAHKGRVTLTLCLPDGYSAEMTTLRFFSRGQWSAPMTGCHKDLSSALYTVELFVDPALMPEKVEITCRGFGGQGICYLAVETAAGRFVPEAILECEGEVWGAERMLEPNVNFAFLGHMHTLDGFHQRSLATEEHRVVISLLPAAQSGRVGF